MLIDINQVIRLTDFRSQAGKLVRAAGQGKTFWISDKGKIRAAVVPPTMITAATQNEDVWTEIEKIRRDMAAAMKGKKTWDSTKVIRQMREERK